MKLTDENFLLFAAKCYDNPQCYDMKEFLEDIKRLKYVKKLFTRYLECNELKERLILNHIIVLSNVFGDEIAKIMFFKLDRLHWPLLKPFLILLNLLPQHIEGIADKSINTDEINMDLGIVEVLRKI